MVDNSGYHRVVMAENRVIQNANKCQIDLSQIIGKPWESVYSVIDRRSGTLKEIEEPQSVITHEFFTGLDEADAPEDQEGAEIADAEMNNNERAPAVVVGEETKDNRNLTDSNNAQRMSHSDVEFLKHSNTGGQEIIDALINNSDTFKDRTAFSKVKYFLKKAQKFTVYYRF